jgi:hypothetical protein
MTRVIGAFATPTYMGFASQLRGDCERFGYQLDLHEEPTEIGLKACWFRKLRVARDMLLRHGSLIFLDVESRILRPLPDEWWDQVTMARKDQPWRDRNSPRERLRAYNTGFMGLRMEMFRVLEAAERGMLRLGLDVDDGRLFGEESLVCEEDFIAPLIYASTFPVREICIYYGDNRNTGAEIVRGGWHNSSTYILHPILHQWANDGLTRSAYRYIFTQHWGADETERELIAAIMDQRRGGPREFGGWFFDPGGGVFAPREFWPDKIRNWDHIWHGDE